MTEREELEIELKAIDRVLSFLNKSLLDYQEKREQLQGKLNRARRLEREELQNAEPKS